MLVLSSLFAGMLAFQNSAARYFFALGRAGGLPAALARVNRFGAPGTAAGLTSALGGAVILAFAAAGLDPVLNLFFWFSGLAVLSIVLIEVLVCAAVIAFFGGTAADDHGPRPGLFTRLVAPALAGAGLLVGLYLLMSRFGLLTGAVAQGVDPATTAWGLNTLGWSLLGLPFAVLALGVAFARGRRLSDSLLQV